MFELRAVLALAVAFLVLGTDARPYRSLLQSGCEFIEEEQACVVDITPLIPSSELKDVFFVLDAECGSNEDAGSCSGSSGCIWVGDICSADVSDDVINDCLEKHFEEDDAPGGSVCSWAVGSQNCSENTDDASCTTSGCEWVDGGGCILSRDLFFDLLFWASDEKQNVLDLQERCFKEESQSKGACL
ncbi:hypothetical protein BSKO_11298 [Bryopsis sp. KO-2023]|nr:hypothetical protein BSKO_11298 [Bryopsis sp. KO-2023]